MHTASLTPLPSDNRQLAPPPSPIASVTTITTVRSDAGRTSSIGRARLPPPRRMAIRKPVNVADARTQSAAAACRSPPRQRSRSLRPPAKVAALGNDTPAARCVCRARQPNTRRLADPGRRLRLTKRKPSNGSRLRKAKPRTLLGKATRSPNEREKGDKIALPRPLCRPRERIRRKPPASTSSAATFRACC